MRQKGIRFAGIALAASALIVTGAYAGGNTESKSKAMSANGGVENGAELSIMGGAHLVSVTEAVLKDFMAKHPEIKINFEKYSYAEYPVKMKIQLAQGTGSPDIILCHDLFITQFVRAGVLMNISDILDKDATLPVLAPVTKDGAYYGIPNQTSNQFVFLYRGDVYDKLGLKPPKSFDEYFNQALVLKKNGYFAGAFNPADEKCHFVFTQYLYMLGGEVLDSNENVSLKKGAEALRLMKKCYDAGIWHQSIIGDSPEYWTAFNDGQIAAFPANAAQAAYYETKVDPKGKGGYGHIRLAPAMKFAADGPETFINNTEYFAINKSTKYPNAAKLVVSYLTQTTEASLKFSNVNEAGLMARYANGYIPGLKEIAKNTNGWASFGGQDVVADLAQNLIDAKPGVPYVNEKTGEIQKAIATVLGEFFMKKSYTPEQAIETMRVLIDRI